MKRINFTLKTLFILFFVFNIYSCSQFTNFFKNDKKDSLSPSDSTALKILQSDLFAVTDSFNVGNMEFVENRLKELEPSIIKLSRHDLAWSYNISGLAKFYLKDNEAGLIDFQKAVKEDTVYYEAFNNIGHMFLLKGQFDDAIVKFEKSLKINPDYESARLNLEIAKKFKSGEMNWNSLELLSVADTVKSPDEKIILYKQLINLAPYYVEIYNNLAVAEFKTGEINEAFKYLNQAITIDPTYAMAYNNIGYLYHEYGLYDDAIQNYFIALKLRPNFLEALENLAYTYKVKGEFDNAILVINKVLEISPARYFAFQMLQEITEEKKAADTKSN